MTQTLTDYITGKEVLNSGSELTRQAVEKLLVEQKGFAKENIRVDEPIEVLFKGEPYASSLDLIVFHRGNAVMAIKCAAGSIGSYEREILSGARLIYDYQIPLAITTDARDAILMDTLTGTQTDQGLEAIPSRDQVDAAFSSYQFIGFDPKKKKREMIIFRSFNMDKTNR